MADETFVEDADRMTCPRQLCLECEVSDISQYAGTEHASRDLLDGQVLPKCAHLGPLVHLLESYQALKQQRLLAEETALALQHQGILQSRLSAFDGALATGMCCCWLTGSRWIWMTPPGTAWSATWLTRAVSLHVYKTQAVYLGQHSISDMPHLDLCAPC